MVLDLMTGNGTAETEVVSLRSCMAVEVWSVGSDDVRGGGADGSCCERTD